MWKVLIASLESDKEKYLRILKSISSHLEKIIYLYKNVFYDLPGMLIAIFCFISVNHYIRMDTIPIHNKDFLVFILTNSKWAWTFLISLV